MRGGIWELFCLWPVFLKILPLVSATLYGLFLLSLSCHPLSPFLFYVRDVVLRPLLFCLYTHLLWELINCHNFPVSAHLSMGSSENREVRRGQNKSLINKERSADSAEWGRKIDQDLGLNLYWKEAMNGPGEGSRLVKVGENDVWP